MIRYILTALLVMAIFISTVQAQESKEYLYGEWVNKEYDGASAEAYPKWDYNSDGTWASYVKIEDQPVWGGKYTITEKWTDSEKIIWYKLKATEIKRGKSTEDYYYLSKISDSGKKLEFVFHASDYLKVINPDKPTYRVYYRHK